MICARTIEAAIESAIALVPGMNVAGVGIDIETNRCMKPDAARFFLNDNERESLKVGDEISAADLLRLWTVKEAIFKADPENTGKILGDYTLENPLHWSGTARLREDSLTRFQYSSVQIDGGFVSIAMIAREGVNAC